MGEEGQTNLTIPAALFASAARTPEADAVRDGAGAISYAALAELALRAGAVLRGLGVGTADRVAIWLPNGADWIVAGLGILSLGGVIVPINTRLKPGEAAYMLRKSGATVLITTSDFLGTDYVAAARGLDLPALAHVLDTEPAPGSASLGERAGAVTRQEVEAVRQIAESLSPDATAEVIFTSGTTGFPKGAMLTHGQITRAYAIYADRAGIGPGDRYLVIAPMFHSFGWKAGVIVSLLRGATIHPVAVFDADAALRIIEAEKITVMGGPPTIFTSLLDRAAETGRDLTSLRSVVLGGSMISPDLIRTLREEVGVAVVLSAYGLTETTALVTMAHATDSVQRIATSAGRVFPGMEMRCADAGGHPLPPGAAGEIQTRGANVMAGYFEDPDRTAESFTPDGWFRTGDVGVIDAEGYLTITDRMKDMFITGGFNCYPAEIEAIIMTHPEVREVAVIGVPDARMGEVAKAFVVPAVAGFDAGAFLGWCRENMANFKVPRSVETLDALPRNAMGKVQKFLLRDRS